MAEVTGVALPFQEQIDFFRQKVNLPTASWTDIVHQQHDRAFVVAGAMRDDLLTDFRSSIDRAIADGTTLQQFRKDFDRIVEQYGWTYNGGRNWRSRVIYETNLSTSYAAGRWQQIQQGNAARPFVRYCHNDAVLHPRPQHVAWDGLVLSVDSPWLRTHWPPNGWGCRCYVEALSQDDLDRIGKKGPDTAPPSDDRDVVIGSRGPNPRMVRTPDGVDPGFGYAPGASWSSRLAGNALDEEAAAEKRTWRSDTPGDWRSTGRPARIPLDATSTKTASPAASIAGAADLLAQAMGTRTKLYDVRGLPVEIDADAIASHIADDLTRSAFLPLLPEALSDPFEVWVTLETDEETGDSRLRARVVKAFALDKGKGLVVVADAAKGYFRGLTVFPTSQLNYLQKLRTGVLLYGR